jgi:hypothetical protein
MPVGGVPPFIVIATTTDVIVSTFGGPLQFGYTLHVLIG